MHLDYNIVSVYRNVVFHDQIFHFQNNPAIDQSHDIFGANILPFPVSLDHDSIIQSSPSVAYDVVIHDHYASTSASSSSHSSDLSSPNSSSSSTSSDSSTLIHHQMVHHHLIHHLLHLDLLHLHLIPHTHLLKTLVSHPLHQRLFL